MEDGSTYVSNLKIAMQNNRLKRLKVTIHGPGAVHSNNSGLYANFAAQKSPLTTESCSHGMCSRCTFLSREK